MRAIFGLVAALSVTAISSCMFIRDFDELQSEGEDASAGSSGEGGSGAAGAHPGTGGSAGEAGGGGSTEDCESDCDDDDPCTNDVCDGGVCRHYSAGAIADGLSATAPDADAQVLFLTGSPSGFYASVTSGNGADSAVALYSFDNEDSDLRVGPAVNDSRVLGGNALRAVPGARVALVAERETPYLVHVFAALTDASASSLPLEGDLANVWQLTLDSDLEPLEPAGVQRLSGLTPDYYVGQLGPIAWPSGNVYHSAWIGENRTAVYLRSKNTSLQRTLGDGSTPVAAIAPLGDVDSNPGVIWLSAGQPARAYGQVVGLAGPSELSGCPDIAGDFYSTHSSEIRSGLWVASFTRLVHDGNEVTGVNTELQVLGCAAESPSCSVLVDDGGLDCTTQPMNGAYDLVTAILTRANEPNIIYEAILLPQYTTNVDEVTAYLQVVRANLDGSGGNDALFVGYGHEVATVTGDPALWSPAVAFSGDEHLAAAWIEAGPSGAGEAHFERYRLCPFTDDDREHPAD